MRKNIIDNINSSVNNSTDHTENYEYMQDFQAMGTTIQLQFNAPKQEWKRIAEKSIRLIDNLEQVMSFYKIDSQISQLNNRAGKEWLSVSPELFFICTEAKRYARLTEGFFDITVAALTEIWQLYGKNEKIPPQSIIENRMKLTNYEGILIDEENKKIKLEKEGQKIDLGGIAKGYAANRVISLYRELGIKSGLVNLGGNVSLLGCHYNGKFWGVGLQNPNNLRGECLGVLFLKNTSI
ncbi:MAG: FAD:protein FMN transferase, partial [Atribacterota bacterium]|nr:FAD:protein FMN transferase [Atribacterota bacterium]